MKKIEKIIAGKESVLFWNEEAEYVLIQPVDENDLEELDNEIDYILKNTKKNISLITFKINDWNTELTPWEMPLVFGKGNFGNGAKKTLEWIEREFVPEIKKILKNENIKYILGGYSLAALFSLWVGYQENDFVAINASSPSVWYKNWIDYIENNKIVINNIYLSLGDKEEKTKNQIMSKVKDNIEIQFNKLKKDEKVRNVVLEWNEGNHFKNSGIRTAKGFVWCLENN